MSRLDISPEVERLELEGYHHTFESSQGDRRALALLQAICFCHDQQIVAPEWAADAFAKASNAWFRLQVCSLDEAFGAKTMTNGRRMQALQRRNVRFKISAEIRQAIAARKSVNRALFEEIGRKVGCSGGQVDKIYYATKWIPKVSDTKSAK